MPTSAEQAYIAAVEASKAADNAWEHCDHDEEEPCAHAVLMGSADDLLDKAMSALAESPRTWQLVEGGDHYGTVEASSKEEALAVARGNVDIHNYGDTDRTFWVRVHVHCKLTGEEASATVSLDPEPPSCLRGRKNHEWTSPHEIVGGLIENPGVHGNGGGVVIKTVCQHCGCERVQDTWAQNPETGEQGLESVAYDPLKYADEVQALLN